MASSFFPVSPPGLWKSVPVLGGLFVASAFASIGLPGFSGFVGEFLALLGAFISGRWYAVVAATGDDDRRLQQESFGGHGADPAEEPPPPTPEEIEHAWQVRLEEAR